MKRRAALGIMLTLLLIGMLTSTFNFAIAGVDEIENIEPVGATGVSVTQAVDWWPMFSHDLQNTGHSTSDAPKTNQTLWVYQMSNKYYSIASGPAVVDGVVFSGSYYSFNEDHDMEVFALNATTGAKIWGYTTGGAVTGTPAVVDGVVYVASGDDKVYALNQSSGEEIWNSTLPALDHSYANPAVTDERVIVAGGAGGVGRLYALNKSNGNLIWEYGFDNFLRWSPAIADGMVFISGAPPSVSGVSLFSLNETTGQLIWNYTISPHSQGGSSPAIAGDIVFVVSGFPDKLYALNKTTGVELWSSEIEGFAAYASPAVAYGMVFVGTYNRKLYAFNQTTGEQIWVVGPVAYRLTSSPSVADGVVYVGSGTFGPAEGGIFYAFSAKTGALLWSYETGYRMTSSNPAIANGMVFATSEGWPYDERAQPGRVYCFYSSPIHDVSVVDVTSSQTTVELGDNVYINVTAENQGDYTEVFNVTAYYDDNAIEEQEVTLSSMDSTTLIFTWNTTGVSTGDYTISASANTVPDEIDTNDNTYVDGVVTLRLPVHEVAVVGVSPVSNVVAKGFDLDVNVTVENLGDFVETFNVTIYANTTTIGKQETFLNSGESAILVFTWNTTVFSLGNYTISAYATPVAEEMNTDDNSYVDGIVTIRPPSDVAVVNVTLSKTVVGQEFSLFITVTIENQGNFTETFNVTTYYNSNAINYTTINNLPLGEETTLTFTWNTTGVTKGNYTISAYATPVLGELDILDNVFVDGTVIVAMIGDITGPTPDVPDGKVDIRDIALVAKYFGQNVPPAPSNCDVTRPITGVPDGKIDIRDIAAVAIHFGQIDP